MPHRASTAGGIHQRAVTLFRYTRPGIRASGGASTRCLDRAIAIALRACGYVTLLHIAHRLYSACGRGAKLASRKQIRRSTAAAPLWRSCSARAVHTAVTVRCSSWPEPAAWAAGAGAHVWRSWPRFPPRLSWHYSSRPALQPNRVTTTSSGSCDPSLPGPAAAPPAPRTATARNRIAQAISPARSCQSPNQPQEVS